ncbi:psbP domain-containing protein 6, chloroplastic isoform X1 [Salvia miltiorrhiza]|uniref:psbP domain-containing protein 6, chloroplastic isoform X1 n=1 Tax=Salvia miltiorrhiza TaxID=226208 RepID=UPI0025AD1BEB|nr:psbP domain-containing protein 6, chloroplastic isoform X1 [Salvia miltiorrhiza]
MAAISSLFFTPNPTSTASFSSFKNSPTLHLSRREFLNGSATLLPLLISPPPPSLAREVEVGSYLPPSPADPSFVLFSATSKDTPALRAGNVEPYKFMLPPTWKQMRIANILSGNYCQPKCAEPWIEVKFEDEKQGKVQVVASPLIRLTNKPNATIEEIGTPDKVIASLGPFVTGNTLDPDELVEASIEKRGDQTVPSNMPFHDQFLITSAEFMFCCSIISMYSIHPMLSREHTILPRRRPRGTPSSSLSPAPATSSGPRRRKPCKQFLIPLKCKAIDIGQEY